MKKAHFLYALPFVLLACDSASDKTEEVYTEVKDVTQPVLKPNPVALLEVSNPSLFARPDTLISLSLNELGVTTGPLQVWQDDTAQPTQLVDDDGDTKPDRLVFLTDLGAAEKHDYSIDRIESGQIPASRTHAEVSIKEGGDWQDAKYVGGAFKNVSHLTNPPQYTDHSEYIRYEGPGIESDQVGYRVYLY